MIESIKERILRREVISAETYGQRLRLFRAGLIIPLAGVGALGSLYMAAPLLMEVIPSPLSIAVPFGAVGLGFAVGSTAGEVLSIAAAKFTTRIQG